MVNPTKVTAQVHDLVAECLRRGGWTDTLWLETSAGDSGRAMTMRAVAEHVDLVIAAGGDGTVRLVAAGLPALVWRWWGLSRGIS